MMMQTTEAGGATARAPARPQKSFNLRHNPLERRSLRNVFLTVCAWLVAALGAVPLFSAAAFHGSRPQV